MSKLNGQTSVLERKARLGACRKRIKQLGADAFLLTSTADYYYLTGFTGDESAVMVTPRDVFIISDRRFEEQLKHECPWAKTYMRRGFLNPEIAKACQDLKVKKLAAQAEHLTIAERDEIQKLAKGAKIIPASRVVAEQRILKSESEVHILLKALRIAEQAFQALRKTIRVGQTELQMAGRLEYEMKIRGAAMPAFPTICAEGPNSALPHAHPGTRKVRKGSAIIFDWGARYRGYNSDLTRMVFVDSIPPKFREIYEITLDAQMAAIAEIRAGRRMCDIDAVARDRIKKAGFGDAFSHGLGHGLGLNVHESPALSWRSEQELEPGMLVTVEPGIYLPGIGGVRIEDDVLVTDKGCRVLSRLNKRLADQVI